MLMTKEQNIRRRQRGCLDFDLDPTRITEKIPLNPTKSQ